MNIVRHPNFDLLVIGAGTAGCIAASTAAKAGLSVGLVDLLASENIGRKVCGDAIVQRHLDALHEWVGLPFPKGKEIAAKIDGIKLVSPDERTTITADDPGFTIDRHLFGQKILKFAVDSGVELIDETRAIKPIIKKDQVLGCIVQKEGKGETSIYGQITIDASGVSAILRKQVPYPRLKQSLGGSALGICYREILQLPDPWIYDHHCVVHFNKRIAPGGYVWYFPKQPRVLNVGVGLQPHGTKLNPRTQYEQYVRSKDELKDAEVLDANGGVVPLMRPLNNFVAPGFMVVGDAACQVNPLDGAGIGYSMKAGHYAASVAIKAINAGDVSAQSLWEYNALFHKNDGAKHAGFSVLSAFIRSTSEDDVNYGFQKQLVSGEDITKANTSGGFSLGILDKFSRLRRGAGRIYLLRRMLKVVSFMKKLSKQYQNYPNFKNYEKWKNQVDNIYEDIKKSLGLSIPT